MKRLSLLAVLLFAVPAYAVDPTATPVPDALDCCDCGAVCSAPVGGDCGACTIVYDASCVAGSCVGHTPTRTITPTSPPTNTRTFTATRTPTSTPTQTSTRTVTLPPASTPFVSGAAILSGSSTISWRLTTFSAQSTAYELVPARPSSKRSQVYYLDAIANGATTVTVSTDGGASIVFNFTAGNAGITQFRSFPVPLLTGPGGVISVSQSGTAAVTVRVASTSP